MEVAFMWDSEILKRSVLFSLVFFGTIFWIIIIIKDLVKKAQKKKAAASEVIVNEDLESPCTIRIKVAKHFTPLVGGPWNYGLSLNGEPPVLVELGSEIELTTTVKHNTILGYGRTTFGSYDKPNKEEPFKFNAVSGGTIRLFADARFENINNHLHWKSNMSFDNSEE